MKKSVISTVALGLIIGVGALTVTSFANEGQTNNQLYTNTVSPTVNNQNQSNNGFKVLNEETNQFEQLDNSEYENYGQGNGGCCTNGFLGGFANQN